MTVRQFYDWQTAGGGGDVSLLVETHPKLRKLLPADLARKIKG
jgi:hypothetical protein